MPRTLVKKQIKIGPADNRRRMSLAKFDHAIGQEGYLYELSRGVITVRDVPDYRHLLQVDAARSQLVLFRASYPSLIHTLASTMECKILIAALESERHPDLAIYKTPPPELPDFWASWIPDIVIEVISRSSRFRDYEEKPEEYLLFGIKEYWILDADMREMLVHLRSAGQWVKQTVRPPEVYRTPLLPGFEFNCGMVFQAADKVDKGKDGRQRRSSRKRPK